MLNEKKLKHIAARFGETDLAALDMLVSTWNSTSSETIRSAVLLAARVELEKMSSETK